MINKNGALYHHECGTCVKVTFYGGKEMDNNSGEIKVVKLPMMKIAKHTIISPNPEEDVSVYMDTWAKESGLLDLKDYMPRSFGWDDDVSEEVKQSNPDFRGYSKCITLPNDFMPNSSGVVISHIEANEYATIRITDPFSCPWEKIPEGWQKLRAYIQNSTYTASAWGFEEVIEIDGVICMDIFIPIKQRV